MSVVVSQIYKKKKKRRKYIQRKQEYVRKLKNKTVGLV
jgi:hypothetical protein